MRLQSLVVAPTKTTGVRLPEQVRIADRPGRRSDQERTVASSGVIDLDQIKRTLALFESNQDKEATKPQSRGHEDKMELTLEQSLEIALQRNLRLLIASLTRDAVQTEIPRAKARFHPTVGLSATGFGQRVDSGTGTISENTLRVDPFIRTEVPTGAILSFSGSFTGAGGGATESTALVSDLFINVVQPLLRGGGTVVATRSIRDAEFDLRIEEALLRAEVLRLLANTKSAYYNTILAEKVIQVTEEAIQRDKTLVEASKALFEAGLVTKRDVFSAEISLARDSARLVNAQADLESAKNTLLDVLGLPFMTSIFLLDKDISFQPVALELERWIQAAMTHRPEVLAVEEELGKSSLNIRVERNAVLPQLDLVASYRRFPGDTALGQALDLSGEEWTAGVVFSFPIGNVAAKSALARAEIEHARLQQRLLQTKRQVELEVRDTVIKLRRSLERMKVLTVGVEQAQGKLEIARARFALGLATNLDITDAQEDLLQAETDLLSAIVDYNIGLAELQARIAAPIDLPGDAQRGDSEELRAARAR